MESLNAKYKEFRDLPVLQMQLAIWTDCMQTIDTRSKSIHRFKSPDWTDYCYNQLQDGFQKARQYRVITASPTTYLVEVSNNKSHTVRIISALPIWESRVPSSGTIDIICTCVYPDDHYIPCKHAIAALREAGEDLTSYYAMATWYSISTYRKTYSFPMDPIRLEDFKDIQVYTTNNDYGSDDPFTEPVLVRAKAPKLARLRGRPKKRRIRKTVEKESKKQYKCSHCGQLGHNRKGCRNGRKEPTTATTSTSISSSSTSSEDEDMDELA